MRDVMIALLYCGIGAEALEVDGFVTCGQYRGSMLNETWQTKHERMWRAFVRLREVVEDTNTGEEIDARDALSRFCLEAFELRDWLRKSKDVSFAVNEAVTRMFGRPSNKPGKRVDGTSVALAACADIANASKHLGLDQPSYSEGGYAEVTYESMSDVRDLPAFAFQVMPDLQIPRHGVHQWMWLITAGGVEYDALMLAEDAMRDWERCLIDQGLLEKSEFFHYQRVYATQPPHSD